MTTSVTFESAPDTKHPSYIRSRVSSGGSASARSHTSSGSRQYSAGSGSLGSDSWSEVGRSELERPYEEREGEGEDDIEPSDSASRARRRSVRRAPDERPTPTRRHSSRRVVQVEEEDLPPPRRPSSHRHHSSRHHRPRDSRRVPSDESTSTVESRDDYPYSHHGLPHRGYPPSSGYRHVPPQSHGGYPPSILTSAPGYADPYAAQQALIHLPHQDPYATPMSANPFSPIGSSASGSYFATDPHAPPMAQHRHRPPAPGRPQSYIAPSSHYGSDVISPYSPPGMPPYGYAPHPGMPGYPPSGWYPPPSSHGSPPLNDRDRERERLEREKEREERRDREEKARDEKRLQKIEDLEKLLEKHEAARIAREKEIAAKAEADAAAAAAAKARAEEEKKKKEEIAAASKSAKEAAEKKAKEEAEEAEAEHEKKIKEAQTAKEEAEKKQKELEAEVAKAKPSPDSLKAPLRFKDAVGRKFTFPFQLCKTWKGMEGLIKQAFLHVEGIGDHVQAGHYDLTGPDGEIILPQVWESMIQPDWEISMHMWPLPEPKHGHGHGKKASDKALADDLAAFDFANLSLADLDLPGAPAKKSKELGRSGSKRKKRTPGIDIVDVGPAQMGPLPPPPKFPPGIDPFGDLPRGNTVFVDDLVMGGGSKKDRERPKARTRSSSKKELPSLAAWMAGSSGRSSKKDDEKLEAPAPVVVVPARPRPAASQSHSLHRAAMREEITVCAVM